MQIPALASSHHEADLVTSKSLATSRELSGVRGQDRDEFKKLIDPGSNELKEKFEEFVGQTLFSQMIKAARSTQQPSAYFHGGRAEEIFQGQFDQVLAEEMSEASAEKIAGPMYELFMLRRQS